MAPSNLPESDRPVAPLGLLIVRTLEVSSTIQNKLLIDGRPQTEDILLQLLVLDVEFEQWASHLLPSWDFMLGYDKSLPSTAVYRGYFHVYPDIWIARMWGHYRWAHVLVNEMIVKFVDRFPETSLPHVSASRQKRSLGTCLRLARDIVVSTPSHWRHPHLDYETRSVISSKGYSGAGAAGVPAMLHHLRVAVCAPGVPKEMFDWAYNLIQSVWANMGMLHARFILDMMDNHRPQLAAAGMAII